MDFDFSEEQEILKKSARDFLTAECPVSLVRAVESDRGYAEGLWKKMAELGWLGLIVPEEFGGTGGSFLDLGILVEEMGRFLAPVPFVPVVLCQSAILRAGTSQQKAAILPELASGKSIMTLAAYESELSLEPHELETKAVRKGDGYILNGAKFLVPYGNVADRYLVVAQAAGAQDAGVSLFILDRGTPGIEVSNLNTIASEDRSQLVLRDVTVGADRLIGQEGKGWAVVKELFQRGAVLKCAEMLGGAQRVLDKTVDYVKQRVQFDRPVGSFQAVQHRCANMAIHCDGVRFVTYQALWLLSEGIACEQEVAIAKAWVNEAYNRICFEAHQAHGAIGFTKEYDLQLYTRRAKAAELEFGDSRLHYEALAQHMGL